LWPAAGTKCDWAGMILVAYVSGARLPKDRKEQSRQKIVETAVQAFNRQHKTDWN